MEAPARFLRRGLRNLSLRDYFAQQPRWAKQQTPPVQQSDNEVAVAEPANTKAAIMINRYFIEFPLLNFLLTPGAKRSRADAMLRNPGSRRWNWRTVGAKTLIGIVAGEPLARCRGNDQGRYRIIDNGQPDPTSRATLSLLRRLRRLLVAALILSGRHLRATIPFHRGGRISLKRNDRRRERKSDRTQEMETDQSHVISMNMPRPLARVSRCACLHLQP